MEATKKKILIIENDESCFKDISRAINKKLGSLVEVYPELDGKKGTIQNFDHFVEEYIELSRYDDILNHYVDTDLFVLDVLLKEEKIESGFQVDKKIKEKYGPNHPPVIMVSNVKYVRKNYVWKGESDYADIVVEEIIKRFPELQQGLQKAKTTTASNNKSWKKTFEDNRELYGSSYTFGKILKWLDDKWKRLIHLCIVSVFYCLIMVTTYYAASSIFREFFPQEVSNIDASPKHPTDKSSSVNNQQLSQNEKDETLILEHAERIFLYLLPIFIVFGFFIYYKTNTMIYFFNGEVQAKDREASTHSMNLTKTIFVSSIISYTLIKVIDKIFFKQNVSLLTLISAGVLLLMLMGYYILINHKHQESKNEDHSASEI